MGKKTSTFNAFMQGVIERLKAEGHVPAAHVHRSALRSFIAFMEHREVRFSELTPWLLGRYEARHSWATIAYHLDVPVRVVSRALGHTSIRTTESYLKPMQYERIDAAHKQYINVVLSWRDRSFRPRNPKRRSETYANICLSESCIGCRKGGEALFGRCRNCQIVKLSLWVP